MAPAISISHVWKRFILRHNRSNALRTRFLGIFRPSLRERREEFWVLQDINLVVEEGESVGIIGANGSGKSTLLRLVARTMSPTRGTILTNGHVAPMIELGLGFHPELTGRENIYLNSSLYGLLRKDTDRIVEPVIEFAELRTFIDLPIKNFSSGMQARLAFALAVHFNPDVLLIDEVLSVGDARFQRKCLQKIGELRSAGKTLLFVSHAAEVVKQVCDRAIWIDRGSVRATGPVDEVLKAYHTATTSGTQTAGGGS